MEAKIFNIFILRLGFFFFRESESQALKVYKIQ